jgi:DNA mismatch endonuclease (patch repair protein)
MVDTFSIAERSEIMRRVRSSGTRPEKNIRTILRRMGIRFRSCPPSLPGKPDLVIFGQRRAIFVHGCFWHCHRCEAGKLPKSNRSYWKRKQLNNSIRDSRNARALRSRGWKLMVIWECEIRRIERLRGRLSRFLGEKS